MNQTLREIVLAALKQGQFDGLYSNDDCGCTTKDFMPCGNPDPARTPGVFGPCDPVTCQADGKCDWHLVPRKE